MSNIEVNVGQHQPGFEEKQEEKQEEKKEVTEDMVKKEVLTALGTPREMSRFNARNVFDNRWRVTIYIHKGKSFAEEISDSFFLHMDENGKIEKSDPKIERKHL